MNAIDNFFNKHRGARRLLLLWAVGLITYATHALFSDISAITAPAKDAYIVVTGLLTIVLAQYQHHRGKDT